jgi:hypothetical protein
MDPETDPDPLVKRYGSAHPDPKCHGSATLQSTVKVDRSRKHLALLSL